MACLEKRQIQSEISSSLSRSGDLALKTYLKVLGGMTGDVTENIKKLQGNPSINKGYVAAQGRSSPIGYKLSSPDKENTNNNKNISDASIDDIGICIGGSSEETYKRECLQTYQPRCQFLKAICKEKNISSKSQTGEKSDVGECISYLGQVSSACENFYKRCPCEMLDDADWRHYEHYHSHSSKTKGRKEKSKVRKSSYCNHSDYIKNTNISCCPGAELSSMHVLRKRTNEKVPEQKYDQVFPHFKSLGNPSPDTLLIDEVREHNLDWQNHNDFDNRKKHLDLDAGYSSEYPRLSRKLESELSRPTWLDKNKISIPTRKHCNCHSKKFGSKKKSKVNFDTKKTRNHFSTLNNSHKDCDNSHCDNSRSSTSASSSSYGSANSDIFYSANSNYSEPLRRKYSEMPWNRMHDSTIYSRRENAVLFREQPLHNIIKFQKGK